MVNYTNGKIYRIVNDANDIIYIGSTAQPLAKRMGNHRTRANTGQSKTTFYEAMREIGIERFKIVLIKAYPCNTKAELEAEEYKLMKEFKANNTQLYNDFVGEMSYAQKQKISNNLKGKMTEEQRQKLSAILTGKCQEDSYYFKHGCISFESNGFRFYWYENTVKKSKWFNCKKYGMYNALLRAYDVRKAMYPDWKTPEETFICELMNIDY